MSWDRLRWQAGRMRLRAKDAEGWHDQSQTVENDRDSARAMHRWLAAHCDGAVVARSEILVSGSTATLSGTLTNETSCYVYFNGMPPYAVAFETDGRATILLGDFNPVPREQPFRTDCVMHPGAIVPYRSLPVTTHSPRPRWDGTDWCVASRSTMLDKAFYDQREVPTLQLIG